MLWAVYCVDKPDTAATREKYLEAHRAYLTTVTPSIFFSGPLQSDDASASVGSLFILNVKGRQEAQAFIDNEPFNKQGIFKSITINRMRKGRFNAGLVDVA